LAAHSEKLLTHAFGGAVGASGEERRHAGDVDDAAVAALGHRLERDVREAEHGGDQDVEHRGLGVHGVVQEPPLEAEARVVDQEIHRAGGLGEPRLDAGQVGAVGQVGGQHLDLDAMGGTQLGGGLLQPFGVARDQHQVVAAGRELLGEGVTDACRGAGHESGLRHGAKSRRWVLRQDRAVRHDGHR
jgi:hypothetical protein